MGSSNFQKVNASELGDVARACSADERPAFQRGTVEQWGEIRLRRSRPAERWQTGDQQGCEQSNQTSGSVLTVLCRFIGRKLRRSHSEAQALERTPLCQAELRELGR